MHATRALLGVAAGATSKVTTRCGRRAAGVEARVCAVLGSQWGDEGKGKLADVLAGKYDIVARFNGGANAGHTVVVDGKKFAFHLLPCGIIHPHTTNLLGNGTVVHLESLFKEIKELEAGEVDWKGRLLLSDRAHLLFDFHKRVDGLAEERRAAAGGAGAKIGTTKQGIGPAYASKATRNGVRVGMLRNRDTFRAALSRLIADTRAQYQIDIDEAAELAKYDELAPRVLPLITDGVELVNKAYAEGRRIIAEGANAALLDLDFGTYPYVTSSSTTVGGIATGLGIAPQKIDAAVGVVKAYTTRVGGGPFPTELTDERGGGDRPLHSEGSEIGLHLQKVGGEIGVTTGRKRRCGWFDAAVVRYSHALNGFTSLNITKLDVLDELETIKIGVGYTIDGRLLGNAEMPSTLEDLARVQVVYEELPGWRTSTRGVTSFKALPPQAQAYVRRIEQIVGVPVAWIGTGSGRNDMITRGFVASD